MSKIRLAEYHFRKAAQIHPKNAVLLGCVGMVRTSSSRLKLSIMSLSEAPPADGSVYLSQAVERRGDREGALALFNSAVKISPDNALVRYRRAKISIAMRKYQVSQQESV